MYENHCRLKTARDRARDLDNQYRRTREQLEREQAVNSRLEQDVRNFEEREKHLKRIKVLKMKRPWVVGTFTGCCMRQSHTGCSSRSVDVAC